MGCETKTFLAPDGSETSAIICTRGRQPRNCEVLGCFQHSEALCDWPMTPPGKTCDLRLCPQHRHYAGPNRDYCPAHYQVAQDERTP